MDFGSSYVYGGKDESPSSGSSHGSSSSSSSGGGGGLPKPTTNIVMVNLAQLENETRLASGDALFCRGCSAVFNKFSHLEKKEKEKDDGDEQLWVCEFCGHANEVNLMEEEIPQDNEVDYIVDVAGASSCVSKKKIFCIDTSGSMCISTEMRGECPAVIRENEPKDDWGDLEGFEKPKNPSNIWYMSRLQGIQSAVSVQMDNMKDHDVCGLITFNGEVSLFGDGKSPTIIGGDELNDLEALKKRGRNGSMGETLERSREQLKKHLWSLQTGGQTALGPAVAVSLSVAANHPGSTVIIATDGLANVGVGDLQSVTTPEDISASKRFYESMATFAQEHSVIVNVLSLASVGENVNLSILGLLNSKTGGTIDLVDPHSIIQQVHEMANSEPIATDVSIAILSHRTFHFIDSAAADTHKSDEESVGKEEGKEKKEKKEKEEEEEEEGVLRCEFLVRKYVGVVSRRTEIPFQFEINRDESDVLPEYLPFQVQIRFTRLDGTKVIRVITARKQVTTNRKDAEANVDVAVVSAAVSKKATSLAAQGNYEEARAIAVVNQQMLSRAAHTKEQKELVMQYNQEFLDIDSRLRLQEQANCLDSIGSSVERLRVQSDELSTVIFQHESKKAAACCVM